MELESKLNIKAVSPDGRRDAQWTRPCCSGSGFLDVSPEIRWLPYPHLDGSPETACEKGC
jgi:hypothetical protein